MSRTTPLGKTLVLTAVVAFGIAVAWGVAVGWIVGVVEQATQSRDDYEQLCVGVDGEPVIDRTSYRSPVGQQVTTLAGEPIKTTSQDLLYPQYMAQRERLVAVSLAGWGWQMAAINDGGTPAIYWYLIHDGNHAGWAYGVGYHSETKMIAGYFGRKGFAEVMPPHDEWFEVAGGSGLYGATTATANTEPYYLSTPVALLPLLANGKLWIINAGQRQVKAVADCPSAFAMGGAWRLPREIPTETPDTIHLAAQATTPSDVLVRQPESLIVVDKRTGKHTTFPLPATVHDAMLAAYVLGDGNLLLLVSHQEHVSHPKHEPGSDVIWLSPSGQVIKQQHVRLATPYAVQSLAQMGWIAAAAVPVPLASGLFIGLSPLGMVERGGADSYLAGLGELLSEVWLSALVVVSIGAVAATLAYRRQRRFGLAHAAAWAVFAFLFGLPGWLAYRFHRRWPVLEDCPACGQPAPRDREACLDCGASFPPPPLKGIEVFA